MGLMYSAEVLDLWVATGGVVAPSVHGRVLAWHDATGQQAVIPPVNALVVQVTCTADELAALASDPALTILWSEEVLDDEAYP